MLCSPNEIAQAQILEPTEKEKKRSHILALLLEFEAETGDRAAKWVERELTPEKPSSSMPAHAHVCTRNK